MELRHLRYFIAVAEELNFSRAARRLHVSQPPLSRQIRDLEAELNAKLLERDRQGVRLTKVGRGILAKARELVSSADALRKKASQIEEEGREELQVGYAPAPTAAIIAGVLRRYHELSPGSSVTLHDLTLREIMAALRSKKIHLGLTLRPLISQMHGFKFVPIRRYSVGIICSHSSPWARLSSIRPADVPVHRLIGYRGADFPEYHPWVAKVLGIRKPAFRFVQQCDGVLSIIAAVESSRHPAVVGEFTTFVAGARVGYIPFASKVSHMDVGLLYPNGEPTQTVGKLIASIKELKP
jgi:DNA-binding transcriptional LysR family regulator